MAWCVYTRITLTDNMESHDQGFFFFYMYGQQLFQLSFISEDWFNKNCCKCALPFGWLYPESLLLAILWYYKYLHSVNRLSLEQARSVLVIRYLVNDPFFCFLFKHVNVHLSLEWIHRGYLSSSISPVNNIPAQNHKSSSEVNWDQSHSEAIMENSYEEGVEILKGIGGKWS